MTDQDVTSRFHSEVDEPASIDLRKARELAAAIRDHADYECCDDETRRLARAVLHLTAELARVEAELKSLLAMNTMGIIDAQRAALARVTQERDEARLAFEQMSATAEIAARDQHRVTQELAGLRRAYQTEHGGLIRDAVEQTVEAIRCQADLDDAERRVAERIAAWLDDEAKMIDEGANPYAPTDDVSCARSDALRSAADDIRAMTWRTGGNQ